jgi:hypothetical protein
VSAELHLALMVDAEIPCDAVQPGRELCLSSELVAALDHFHPDVLIQFLGASAIPSRSQQEVEKRRTVSFEQRFERARIAFSIGCQQHFVRGIAQNAPPSSPCQYCVG